MQTRMADENVVSFSRSAVILRFGHFQYRPLNCSLRFVAESRSLDGLAAVVEEMDLRERPSEYEGRNSRPGGGWANAECIDYVEAYTDQAKVGGRCLKLISQCPFSFFA